MGDRCPLIALASNELFKLLERAVDPVFKGLQLYVCFYCKYYLHCSIALLEIYKHLLRYCP